MFFYLYMILDVFSRKIVGWEVHSEENGFNAAILVQKAIFSEACVLEPPVLHSDNGSPQKGSTLRAKLEALGIAPSYSRPHVSNDNPYSESQFKTLKYCPAFPDRFGSIQDSRSFCQDFFPWYNKEHRHCGIGLMTPESVHYGLAKSLYEHRKTVLEAAFKKTPNRFKGKKPQPPQLPKTAWINPPSSVVVGA